MPALPSRPVRCFFSLGSRAASIFASSILSTLESTRLTKKLATEPIFERSPPFLRRSSRPDWKASTTAS